MIKQSFNNLSNQEFVSSMEDVTMLETVFDDLDSSTGLTNSAVGCIIELDGGCRYS